MRQAEIQTIMQVAPPTIPQVEVPILPQIKSPIKTPATTRQTRSSRRGAKVALESLNPIEELSQSQLR